MSKLSPDLKLPFEESLCRCTIASRLYEHIDYLAILIDGPPQVMLFSSNFCKHFIEIKSIGVSSTLYKEDDKILRLLSSFFFGIPKKEEAKKKEWSG